MRHQVTVLRRQHPGQLRLVSTDRLLWVSLYRVGDRSSTSWCWSTSNRGPVASQRLPASWRWRSRRLGRPQMSPEIRDLVKLRAPTTSHTARFSYALVGRNVKARGDWKRSRSGVYYSHGHCREVTNPWHFRSSREFSACACFCEYAQQPCKLHVRSRTSRGDAGGGAGVSEHSSRFGAGASRGVPA